MSLCPFWLKADSREPTALPGFIGGADLENPFPKVILRMTHSDSAGPLVVGLGEALFDRFGDVAVLGGAPINFAVHANQLLAVRGGRGAVATRIGDDELGQRLTRELDARGLALDALQVDPQAPTGVVEVTLDDDGQPSYDIRAGAAWDQLQFDDAWQSLAGSCHAVCFGTLAQRTATSRAAIHAFLAAAPQALRLCDLNLRPPHYDNEVIRASLAAANAVKLNEDELQLVAELMQLPAGSSADAQMFELMKKCDLQAAILTRGAEGTAVFRGERWHAAPPPPLSREPDADAVGAGDACGAAATCGLLAEWPLEQIVELANAAGGFVASRQGATPELPAELKQRLAS